MAQQVTVIKESFSGGEFDPLMQSRIGLQKYWTGCRVMRNFFAHQNGAASNRPGLEMIAQTKGSNAQTFDSYTKMLAHFDSSFTDNAASKVITTVGAVDSATKLLLHGDGSLASTTISDSSPSAHGNATVVGKADIDTAQSKFGGSSIRLPGGNDVQTKLLLHFDGADASTTFTDSASGAKTVTPHGSAQIDTAQSKFGGTSGLFAPGTIDYLSVADSDDFYFSGDFTIDTWVRYNNVGPANYFFQFQDDSNAFAFVQANSTTISFSFTSGGVIQYGFNVAFTPTAGTWYHIALVRNGNNWYVFINGVSQTLTNITGSASAAVPNYTGAIWIGGESRYNTYLLDGWLDEYRVSKVARRISNFTVPANPYGGSTGDYAYYPDNADWNFGANNFTIDFWMNLNSLYNYGIMGINQSTFDKNNQIAFYGGLTGYMQFYVRDANAYTAVLTTPTGTITTNTWFHVAVVRNGTTWKIYINGVAKDTQTFNITVPNYTGNLDIGRTIDGDSPNTYQTSGWIEEFRISNSARWTSDFTVPDYPYGSAPQLDTTTKEFGVASGRFTGDGYLTLADSADWFFSTTDFSIDFWVNLRGLQDTSFIGQYVDANNYWAIWYDNSNNRLCVNFKDSGVERFSFYCSWTPTASTWYHIAVVRDGNTSLLTHLFINGVDQTKTLVSADYTGTCANLASVLYIGQRGDGTKVLNGWMDEIRVSNGTARWTNNFTPPTSAYSPTVTSNKTTRLIPFKYSTTQAYMLEFGDLYVRFYMNKAQITSGGNAVEVVTPYSQTEVNQLYFTQSADTLFIAHPNHAPQMLQRISDTSWTLTAYPFTGGPFLLENTNTGYSLAASALTGNVTLTASGHTPFVSTHVGSLWHLFHYIPNQALASALTGTGATASISCGGTWRIITHGTWAAKFNIEKSTDGGTTWTALREFSSSSDFNANTFGTEDMSDNAPPFLVRINVTSYTSGTINIDLTADPFIQDGIISITTYSSSTVVHGTVVRAPGSTANTTDWAEGAWSDYRGWPGVVEFTPDDRLMFANNVKSPQNTWITKTSNYYDFSVSNPLVASDAINITLPSRQVNGINGIIPLRNIIALTTSGEWSIESSQGGAVTPTTVFQKVHGYHGSSGIAPVVVGNRGIYMQALSNVVRDIGYELVSDSFVGANLSLFSQHLFNGYTISGMAYQQNPESIVWMIRSDGIMLSLTYLREQEVVSFAWHDTDGDFKSIASIPSATDNYDELWVIVDRDNGQFIECMPKRLKSSVVADQFFVDCGYNYTGSPASTISGLTWLNNKIVSILADGVELPKQVVTNNAITLGATYTKVIIGLPYTCDIEPVNVEISQPGGTIQGKTVNISKTILKVVNSSGGMLGPNFTTMYAIQDLANNPSSLFTGDASSLRSGGYQTTGTICFRSTSPLPITITAMIFNLAVGGISTQ